MGDTKLFLPPATVSAVMLIFSLNESLRPYSVQSSMSHLVKC